MIFHFNIRGNQVSTILLCIGTPDGRYRVAGGSRWTAESSSETCAQYLPPYQLF